MKIYFIKRYIFKESFLSNITSVVYFYIFIISYNILIKRHIIASILLLWIYILYKIKFDTGNPSIVLILEKKKKEKKYRCISALCRGTYARINCNFGWRNIQQKSEIQLVFDSKRLYLINRQFRYAEVVQQCEVRFLFKGSVEFRCIFFFISLDKILDFSLSFSSSPALGFAIF